MNAPALRKAKPRLIERYHDEDLNLEIAIIYGEKTKVIVYLTGLMAKLIKE